MQCERIRKSQSTFAPKPIIDIVTKPTFACAIEYRRNETYFEATDRFGWSTPARIRYIDIRVSSLRETTNSIFFFKNRNQNNNNNNHTLLDVAVFVFADVID